MLCARVSLLVLLASACVVAGGGSTGTGTEGTAETASAAETGGTGSGAGTGSSGGATSQGPDVCPSRAIGEWNACHVGPKVDNSLCNWTASDKAGVVSCLSPAGGGLNVCGIEGCAEDCDCFAPPATGTAVVTCAPILGDGGKACALYCAGGQTCPDGMQCRSGYCYWPD